MIPYAMHTITEDDIAAVARVLRSDRLTQGSIVCEFEKALAAKTGYPHAVALSSGTSALEALYGWMRAEDIKIVRTSPLTFAATATAMIRQGITPRFGDVDDRTLCLSRMGMNIVGVDFAGYPSPFPYEAVDAAHSLGANQTHPCDTRVFSFHPTKAIAAGEGGAVVTRIGALARFARVFRDHGRVGERVEFIGTNARMSEIHAALALSQLSRLDPNIARRRSIAARYHEAFARLEFEEWLHRPAWHDGHAWHLYVLRIDPKRRDAFRSALADRGVGTQVHYPIVWDHPGLSYLKQTDCPVAEKAAKEVVSIPMWSGLPDKTVGSVIDAVEVAARATT